MRVAHGQRETGLLTATRLIAVMTACALWLGVCAGSLSAAPQDDHKPAPKSHPAAKPAKTTKPERTAKPAKPEKKAEKTNKTEKPGKAAKHKETHPAATAHKGGAAPAPHGGGAARVSNAAPVAPPPAVNFTAPVRTGPPLALAESGATSPLDLSAVKQAISMVHKDRADEATNIERTISDPVARKLVEWAILRSDDAVEFPRYAAFIAANPTWPSLITLRRHAEAALWQQQVDAQTTLNYFRAQEPLTAKGYFALARALLVKGDVGRATNAVRTAWQNDGFSETVEAQARTTFAGLITPTDDKVRMDARLYLGEDDAGMRAAQHLDGTQQAIARARAAVNSKAGNAKALLEAVPAAARHDPGYMFSRIQWLRRNNDIKEAAQWMLAAPHDPSQALDVDDWWTERRLVARKLLDLGDAKTAYAIAEGAATPASENPRAEQEFTAGWIALQFLNEPAVALPHFARIAEGVSNPITLARSFYWQGRAAQALGREHDARGYYEVAARFSTAYYGQLARAELHLDAVALREPPAPEHRPLEVGRAFEILYAIDERDLVAGMAADIGDKSSDGPGLARLAEIAAHHNDARATLLIGKAALGHGLPFERYAFPDFGVPDYRQIGPQVERCVVYSIVRQESAFNTKVVSSAHALGLMQVTPAAGRNTARKFKVPFDQKRLLGDVVYNAQLGTAELGDEIASWRGSYILSFVAYNAGPRRAREWIEQYGDPRDARVDPVDWIERIPISETRYYVQRILENMQIYRARIENNPRLLIEADLRRGG
jgi:soluble lytic murein transglycosylase